MLYPFVLEPILAPKPWGGDRLAGYGKAVGEGDRIGESWEVADLDLDESGTVPHGTSRVANGPLAGRTLRSVVLEHGADLLGHRNPAAAFPLLVKFLDAREHLSVQVHPTANYVSRHPGAHLKTESWYVIEANPGAVIYKGFQPGTSRTDVVRTAPTSRLVDHLAPVAVAAGDFHHLPAGTIHALGAGVVVAEIQTPSDTTFRLFDWSDDLARPTRNLQVSEALECLDYAPPPTFDLIDRTPTSRTLIVTDHYWIDEHRILVGGPVELRADPGMRILMVIDGDLKVGDVTATKGTTVVVPDSSPTTPRCAGPCTILEIGLP